MISFRSHVAAYEQCVAFVGLAAQQPMDQSAGQHTATGVLTSELCAGAPNSSPWPPPSLG